MAFATTGPHTRGTQLFINYDDNHNLDTKGIVPFGRVVDGMGTLSAVYSGYRERPKQSLIRAGGNAYLHSEFPRLSYIIRAQQVAFIEEPYALSKNASALMPSTRACHVSAKTPLTVLLAWTACVAGLLLTFGMVLAAVACCGVVRLLQKRLATEYKSAC